MSISRGMMLATVLHIVWLFGVWFFFWRESEYVIAVICGLLLVAPPVVRATGSVFDGLLRKHSSRE